MATLLIIFAISIGAATFVEDKWDTEAAQRLIYHAWWFKTVMILLCVNFIGNINRYRLLRKEKWSILLIHIGLIVTIIGAGVTHYIGYEGIIRLKEGELTSRMWTSEPYLEVRVIDEASGQMYKHPMVLKPTTCELLSNYFEFEIDPFKKGNSKFEFVDFQANKTLGEPTDSCENGINCLELVFEGMISEYLPEGGFIEKGGYVITYNNIQTDAINITGTGEDLEIQLPVDVGRLSMQTQTMDTLFAGVNPFKKRHLHTLPGLNIVLKAFRYKLDRPIVDSDNGQDILQVKVSHNGEERIFSLWGGKGAITEPEPFVVGGETFYMRFGPVEMDLPFSVRLDDFVLGTYPGSDRHSSYRSEITIYPKGANPMDGGVSHSVYMNHPLDFEGYRMFQASYDMSGGVEMSQFSVNHDFVGTWITYIGYIILSIGFIFSLFNKSSRFVELGKRLSKSTTLILALLTLTASNLHSQTEAYHPVSQEHCDNFNSLLVVSYTGRIEPCNSLAFDLIRKLTRKDYWSIEGTDYKLSPEQFMLDLFIEPGYWANQKLMKFEARTGLGKDLGVEGNFIAFTDIINIVDHEDGQYLEPKFFEKTIGDKTVIYTYDSLIKWAESKPLSERNTFDKEVLKLNEKIAIFMQATQGELLKIVPIKSENKIDWVNWFMPQAEIDISQGMAGDGITITASKLIRSYLNELVKGKATGDYSGADFFVEKLKTLQRQVYKDSPNDLPSEEMVNFEVTFNQLNLFSRLKNYYAYLALLLLPLALIERLSERKRSWLKITVNILVGVLFVFFLAHTANLALRWYIVNHAPWSDGYEALTTIAWGIVLAGLIFTRYSKITTGATALMAFLILMTAGHSQYDPQMSDLEPVLKSYWLNIHVACITLSYSFFGLGFILSLINMGLILGKNGNNHKKNDNAIIELTSINEMTLTIGLVLATIGTFLGGVWANESWGRYWGWDAKETWALVIVLVYAFVLHMRFVPGLRGKYIFNVISGLSFSTVIMTFVGVNYYLTKGLHSYARGDAPAFAWWVWAIIGGIFALFILAGIKERRFNNK